MLRSILFCLSFLLSLVAALWALPKLAETEHLEAALSSALGAEISIDGEADLRLWPTPKLMASKVSAAKAEPNSLASTLGLVSADQVSAELSWPLLALKDFKLAGGVLKPDVSGGNYDPIIDRFLARAANTSVDIKDTKLALSDAVGHPLDIEGLSLNLTPSDDGNRRVRGELVLNGAPIAFDGSLEPLSTLGQSKVQSTNIAVRRLDETEDGERSLAFEGTFVGSFSFTQGEAPTIVGSLVSKQAPGPGTFGSTSKVSVVDSAASLEDIRLDWGDWELAGKLDLADGGSLILDASDLASTFSGDDTIDDGIIALRKQLDRAYEQLAKLALPDIPLSITVNALQFGPISAESIKARIRPNAERTGYIFDRLRFDTSANGLFVSNGSTLGEELVLKGSFTSASPSIFLKQLGFEAEDPRIRSNLPDLTALGEFRYRPKALGATWSADFPEVTLQNESFSLIASQDQGGEIKISALGTSLLADYLEQDLAPTQGLAEQPLAWLEQRLDQLPPFTAELSFSDLRLGSLNLGRSAGQIAWDGQKLALSETKQAPNAAQALRIDNLYDSTFEAKGDLVFAQTDQGLVFDTFEAFEMSLGQSERSMAKMVESLTTKIDTLARQSSPFKLTPDLGQNWLTKLAISMNPVGDQGEVDALMTQNFSDGSSLEALARLSKTEGADWQAQVGTWGLQKAAGLDLAQLTTPELAKFVPVAFTRLRGALNNPKFADQIFLDFRSESQDSLQIIVPASPELGKEVSAGLKIIGRTTSDNQNRIPEIVGQVSLSDLGDGYQISSDNLLVDGLRTGFDLSIPHDPNSISRGQLSLGQVDLSSTSAQRSLLSLALAPLEEMPFNLDLSVESLTLDGQTDIQNLTAFLLSDGNQLQMIGLEASMDAAQLAVAGTLSLGLLPRLEMTLDVTDSQIDLDLFGSQFLYQGAVQSEISSIGGTLGKLLESASLQADFNGQLTMMGGDDRLGLDLIPELDAQLGEATRKQLQTLFGRVLLAPDLAVTGSLRYIDTVLRSSGLQASAQAGTVKVTGRMNTAEQSTDSDVSVFFDDPLIPAAALELEGALANLVLRAFGTLL